MKKIALTSLMAVFAVSAANAGVFDINYRPMAGNLHGQFGVAFTTGANDTGDALTDFTSGDFGLTGVKLAYGLTDTFSITLDTEALDDEILIFRNGMIATPELGINWRALDTKSFGIDIIAKYGMALTESHTDGRIGINNLQAGLKMFGTVGDLQWGVQALGQYALESNIENFMDILLLAQVQYNLNAKYALALDVNYNIIDLAKTVLDAMLYERSVSLGMIYNVSETSAIKPYVLYHFDTLDDNNESVKDNFFQIGAKFSVQF